MKRFFALLALLCVATTASAFTVGSFNVEYFDAYGSRRYSDEDMRALAKIVTESKAGLIALQEIEGASTMSYFTSRFLPRWKFIGNDTKGRQDLFFLYNPEEFQLLQGPVVFFANRSFYHEGKTRRLFSRPPLAARFKDLKSGITFTAVNVHLKSGSTRGNSDKDAARRYNNAKRAAQVTALNQLARQMKGSAFILGDYNDPHPSGLVYPLISLPPGQYSYDGRRSNLDYIGYQGISFANQPFLREIETSLPSRSERRHQHPDHDLVLLDLSVSP